VVAQYIPVSTGSSGTTGGQLMILATTVISASSTSLKDKNLKVVYPGTYSNIQ